VNGHSRQKPDKAHNQPEKATPSRSEKGDGGTPLSPSQDPKHNPPPSQPKPEENPPPPQPKGEENRPPSPQSGQAPTERGEERPEATNQDRIDATVSTWRLRTIEHPLSQSLKIGLFEELSEPEQTNTGADANNSDAQNISEYDILLIRDSSGKLGIDRHHNRHPSPPNVEASPIKDPEQRFPIKIDVKLPPDWLVPQNHDANSTALFVDLDIESIELTVTYTPNGGSRREVVYRIPTDKNHTDNNGPLRITPESTNDASFLFVKDSSSDDTTPGRDSTADGKDSPATLTCPGKVKWKDNTITIQIEDDPKLPTKKGTLDAGTIRDMRGKCTAVVAVEGSLVGKEGKQQIIVAKSDIQWNP